MTPSHLTCRTHPEFARPPGNFLLTRGWERGGGWRSTAGPVLGLTWMNGTVCSGLLNSQARGLWCCFPPPVTTSWGSMAARQQDRKVAALSNPYHRPDPALMGEPHEHKQGARSRWNHGPKWPLISIATETHLWPRCQSHANTRDKSHAHKPQDPAL